MITQLNPPLPLETVKGPGLAHLVIDYGPEVDLLWVVFLDKDGACWSIPNPDVRMRFNWSMGRRKSDVAELPAETPLAPASGDGNVTRVFPRKSES